MKKYILMFIFNQARDKVLLIKRKRNPFIGKYNGIGGHIEGNETIEECCRREVFEEIGIKIDNPIHLVTHNYSKTIEFNNKGVELSVFYYVLDEFVIEDNEEGSFHWMDISFAGDFDNKELAGYANVAILLERY